LRGGQGTTFKAGSIILKPISNSEEYAWIAENMNTIQQEGFRVAQHLKTKDGEWIHAGWGATEFIDGREEKDHWEEKINVSRKFHKMLARFPRPDFIAKAMHPWAIADRKTWGELPFTHHERLSSALNRLRALLKPLSLPNQLMHGDMTGNILFHEGLLPAIIDFSFYWRPAEFATAIIIVDAVVWEGAPDSLMDKVENSFAMNQLLVRAEIRRILEIGENQEQFKLDIKKLDEVDAHEHIIDLLTSRVENG